jgi:hypothetical protein
MAAADIIMCLCSEVSELNSALYGGQGTET